MGGEVFSSHVSKMPDLFDQLMARDPLPLHPQTGWKGMKAVYALFEGGKACHVGRTRNLAQRIRGHLANSHYSASFAFAQTRRSLGVVSSYRKREGREAMLTRPDFRAEFDSQRQRIRRMQLRFVSIDHPVDQHLFELYAALELGTSLNEFETS
jgi:hypothetical protein